MKLKSMKLMKVLTTKRKGSKEVQTPKTPNSGADSFQPSSNELDSQGYLGVGEGAASASPKGTEDIAITNEEDSDWETEAANSSVGTGTSADLMKCLNTLRIRSVSKSQTSSLQSSQAVPRLPPPPPSLSSRGSFELRGSTEGQMSIKSYGSLKMRPSLTSIPSSMTELPLHIDARSREGSVPGSPFTSLRRDSGPPPSVCSSGFVHSRLSEASENYSTENCVATATKGDDKPFREGVMSAQEQAEKHSSSNDNPTVEREDEARTPSTTVRESGSEECSEDMLSPNQIQWNDSYVWSEDQRIIDEECNFQSRVKERTTSVLARRHSLPVPRDWQQFSIPVDSELRNRKMSTTDQKDPPNLWAEDRDDHGSGASASLDVQPTRVSPSPEEDSAPNKPSSPNPFATWASFKEEKANFDNAGFSPKLPLESAPNPFADESASIKSSEPLAPNTHQPTQLYKDGILDSAFHKTGLPQLQIVETINATFSGEKLSRYVISGEVQMKLSAGHYHAADSQMGSRDESSFPESDAFDPYSIAFQLKCISKNVYLKQFLANVEMFENDKPGLRPPSAMLQVPGHSRTHSVSMNEARRGVVESRVLDWNLAKCMAAANSSRNNGSQGIVLLRYSVRASSSPPLRAQVRWRRPRKAGQNVFVDIAIVPGQQLATSLWGVTVTLKGLEFLAEQEGGPTGKSEPKAEWSSRASAFQWRVPVIYPEDGVRHFRLSVADNQVPSEQEEKYNISADISFVIPHMSLSGTTIQGWIEKTDPGEGDYHANLEESDCPTVYRMVFSDRMCVSGSYTANTDYH